MGSMKKHQTLKISSKMFNDLKSSLKYLNEDTEHQLVVCLSYITYHHSVMNNKIKENSLKKRNLDIAMTDELFESLFNPNY